MGMGWLLTRSVDDASQPSSRSLVSQAAARHNRRHPANRLHAKLINGWLEIQHNYIGAGDIRFFGGM
jgi:hypothetical protein